MPGELQLQVLEEPVGSIKVANGWYVCKLYVLHVYSPKQSKAFAELFIAGLKFGMLGIQVVSISENQPVLGIEKVIVKVGYAIRKEGIFKKKNVSAKFAFVIAISSHFYCHFEDVTVAHFRN